MKLLKQILSYLPSKLPVGATAYNKFVDDIIELSGPYADRDSMAWAISNMIMHLPSTKASVPKNYFVKCLRKTAANQVAAQVFTDIKERQQAAQKTAEEAAKLAAAANSAPVVTQPVEATTLPQVASNETKETAQS